MQADLGLAVICKNSFISIFGFASACEYSHLSYFTRSRSSVHFTSTTKSPWHQVRAETSVHKLSPDSLTRFVHTEAFVTLATNDNYALGALVWASSLRQVGTQKKIAVLITKGVSDSIRLVSIWHLQLPHDKLNG